MNEAQDDHGESAWQWRDPDGETGPYEFGLADLWSPREFRGHMLRCLDRMEKGLIGHLESMMFEIVFDVAAAPDRYLELFDRGPYAFAVGETDPHPRAYASGPRSRSAIGPGGRMNMPEWRRR